MLLHLVRHSAALLKGFACLLCHLHIIVVGVWVVFRTFSPGFSVICHFFQMASPVAPGIEPADLIAGETVNSLVTAVCLQDPYDLDTAKNDRTKSET